MTEKLPDSGQSSRLTVLAMNIISPIIVATALYKISAGIAMSSAAVI